VADPRQGTEPPGATPSPATPGPVPSWAPAQVPPWGVDADDLALRDWRTQGITPGLQDIYKELRTGRRPETGFYPVSPEVALSMIAGVTARFEPLGEEGRDRTTPTEWDAFSEDRDGYLASKASRLLADEGTEPPGTASSPAGPGPVPAWALAQVPPWGVETDYHALKGWMGLGITPGMQDIYKELRTGRRSGTGSAPVGPEDAMLMTLTLIDEAYDRAPPEWDEMAFQQRLHYVEDRAWKLMSD